MNCGLTPESRKTTVGFCHAGLHTEVLLKLKQGPGLSPSNQDTHRAPRETHFAAARSMCPAGFSASWMESAPPSRATVLEGHSQSPGCARGQSPTSPPAPWACPAGAALPWTRAQALCAKLIAAPLSSSPQQFTFCLPPSEWSEPLQPNDVH